MQDKLSDLSKKVTDAFQNLFPKTVITLPPTSYIGQPTLVIAPEVEHPGYAPPPPTTPPPPIKLDDLQSFSFGPLTTRIPSGIFTRLAPQIIGEFVLPVTSQQMVITELSVMVTISEMALNIIRYTAQDYGTRIVINNEIAYPDVRGSPFQNFFLNNVTLPLTPQNVFMAPTSQWINILNVPWIWKPADHWRIEQFNDIVFVPALGVSFSYKIFGYYRPLEQ